MTAPTRGGADEIREQLAAVLRSRNVWWAEDTDGPLDALLSGPLAPLLALRQRVWNLAEDGGHEGWISARALYDLLDGT